MNLKKGASTFMAWMFRMPLIQRWPLMHCVKPENVAEHSHQVAIVAHTLAVIKNELFGGNINPEKAGISALYHESSEPLTGDCPSPVKYSSPELTKAFKSLEHEAEKACLNSLPEELRSAFSQYIIADNMGEEYARIVKAADIICAYVKTRDEVRHNNPEFHSAEMNLKGRLDALTDMPEVKYFCEVFLDSCVSTLDQLSE
jgi:5'-deoxynucleotidase